MYEQIAQNKRASILLVAAVALVLALLGFVIAEAFGAPWWSGVITAVAAAVIAFLTSYYGGSAILLSISGAREIQKEDHPRLFNVVEEMAIAAGLPMPRIFIIEDSAPNAFATGRDPEHACVAVTRGLLEKLNRDELQGVIAHELAHVKNLDIRLSMLLAVLVGSIALLADLFLQMVRHGGLRHGGRRSRDDHGGQVIFLVLGLLLAIVAPLFARLLELAVSRRREYLADATAALLTRYPDGLASALQKIADDREVLEAANRATQHLYIVNPIKPLEEHAARLFDTHPPIHERIRRLREMGFKGEARPASAPLGAPTGAFRSAPADGPDASPVRGRVGAAAAASASPAGPAAVPLSAERTPCPRCQEPLLRGRIAGRPVLGCPQCGGIWIGSLDCQWLLTEAPDRLDASDRRFPNRIGYGWDRVSVRKCPACGEVLAPYRMAELASVWLDRCPRCHGLWFDDGELSALASAARQAGLAHPARQRTGTR